jgi:hypothetical protein
MPAMGTEARERARHEFKDVLAVIRARGVEIAALPGIAAVRPGYSIAGDAAAPALVLAFHAGAAQPDAAALAQQLGVPVLVTLASPEEALLGAHAPTFVSPLLALLDPTEAPGFGRPERGNYQPPKGPGAPRLEPIDAVVEVTLCASPDAGWPVLRDFFAEGVKERLTVAMYDFTAGHVEDAVVGALGASGASFRLVLDGKPASGGVGGNGINGRDSAEADVIKRVRKALGSRFELAHASVGAGGAVPNAYHIKVAVADGKRLWLSSGNWQSSNLAPFDFAVAGSKPPKPIGDYNRDYHVVVNDETLARTYAEFIEHDARLGGAFAGPVDQPMLLVPDELLEPPDFAPPRRFKPKTLKKRMKITPLLTPDNFPGFVNDLLAGAKKRVWIQNQYIKPLESGDNFPEFERLVALLGELASRVDLRLCLRGSEGRYRDRLFAAGVRPAQLRHQSICHAKLIIVDDEHLVVGSQNLSNVGYVANRDASLAFESRAVTSYFAEIFDHDWGRARPVTNHASFGVTLATGHDTPRGYTRVPWSAVYDAPPPERLGSRLEIADTLPGDEPAPANVAAAAAAVLDIPLFGVDENGRRGRESSAAAASALRRGHGAADEERAALGRASRGLPPGATDALDEAGWGVVWGAGVSQATKDALRPLLDRRREQAGDVFVELDHIAGESVTEFLGRREVFFGAIRPEAVPYHLLLVGTPDQVPFAFQSILDVEYRVGRLDLPDEAAYRRYADSVIAVETGAAPPRERAIHAFGPEHPGDEPTTLSVDTLVRAALKWPEAFKKVRDKHGVGARADAGDDATKARLLDLLRGAGRPELLFTAGHGLLVSSGRANQEREQGALITADWDGLSAIDDASRLAAADVPADADVHGMVAFLFACFGAGTPATDSFPTRAGQPLAPRPFVAALPQALLAHPKGGALGVFGHIDRTLTWSLQPPDGATAATDPFARAAFRVLAGATLGAALDDLNGRGASLASVLAQALRPGAPPVHDVELVRTWTQQRDAAAFILLGDPAARLPR